MTAAVLVSLGFWVAAVLFAILSRVLDNRRRDPFSDRGFIPLVACVAAVVAGVLFPAIVFGSRAVGDTTCRNWGQQVGVPVQFKVLNWADTGTCFARTPAGQWIPSDNWFSYVRGGKP